MARSIPGDRRRDREIAQSFLIFGRRIRIASADPDAASLVRANFLALSAPETGEAADVSYRIERRAASAGFALTRAGRRSIECAGAGDLLYSLERDLVVALQRLRPDLLFLHAAALDRRGRAFVLAAESGTGKSTTAWGLVRRGFGYLSDELSPIDLEALHVLPYPHALGLKPPLPPGTGLPPTVIDLGRTIHVPVDALPSGAIPSSRLLGAIFLLERPECGERPEVRPLGPAEASARLYVNVLNALAHPRQGLDAVVRVAGSVPCLALKSADVAMTCALIEETIESVAA